MPRNSLVHHWVIFILSLLLDNRFGCLVAEWFQYWVHNASELCINLEHRGLRLLDLQVCIFKTIDVDCESYRYSSAEALVHAPGRFVELETHWTFSMLCGLHFGSPVRFVKIWISESEQDEENDINDD
ncbi:hypothetical protein Droror1_Dr00024386 [Drosera rotundifolia]